MRAANIPYTVRVLAKKNDRVSAMAVLTYMDAQPSFGIIKTSFPLIWPGSIGSRSGVGLPSPWVWKILTSLSPKMSTTLCRIISSPFQNWMMSPTWIFEVSVDMTIPRSPTSIVGLILPLPITDGKNPNSPVEDHTISTHNTDTIVHPFTDDFSDLVYLFGFLVRVLMPIFLKSIGVVYWLITMKPIVGTITPTRAS